MRALLAFLAFLIGLYLVHEVSVYQGVLAGRGQGEPSQLLADAPFLLRMTGAVVLTLGGVLSLKTRMLGLIVLTLGVAAHLVLVGAMIAMGADISLWQDDALLAGGLVLLPIGLFVLKKV